MNYPDAEGYERYCDRLEDDAGEPPCRFCDQPTLSTYTCDSCLQDIDTDRRIDERRGK